MVLMRFGALLTAASMLLATPSAWATDVAQSSSTTPPPMAGLRSLDPTESRTLERLVDFETGALMACVVTTETGRRERAVTQRMPFMVTVDAEGVLAVRYTGEEDNDATPDDGKTVQECVDAIVATLEYDDVPQAYRSSRYSWSLYNDTYLTQRRKRHSEIIALYTLSAVSLGSGIGALVAAGNDRDDAAAPSVTSLDAGEVDRNTFDERADRFRIAGWTMIGVSAASFIGADILLIRNRRIERNENPYFAASPVGPNGSLGLSFSGRF